MSQDLSISEKSLPIMLLRAREAVMQRFRPMLKAHALSEQQWRVLRVLDELGPSEPTELAKQAVILTPSLTRILANLEDRNLINRTRHEKDGRRYIARISPTGRTLIAKITPESIAIYAQLEADFGAADFESLLKTLRNLSSL